VPAAIVPRIDTRHRRLPDPIRQFMSRHRPEPVQAGRPL
jgi:hypothetical protein